MKLEKQMDIKVFRVSRTGFDLVRCLLWWNGSLTEGDNDVSVAEHIGAHAKAHN